MSVRRGRKCLWCHGSWHGDDLLSLHVVLVKKGKNNLHFYSRLDTDTMKQTQQPGGVISSSIDDQQIGLVRRPSIVPRRMEMQGMADLALPRMINSSRLLRMQATVI